MKPHLTVRGRLTLVYGGLFLLAGLVMLTVTYVLVSHQLLPSARAEIRTAQAGVAGVPQLTVNQIAEDTRADALSLLLTQGGIALALVSTAAIAIGWLVAGRLLEPLQQITRAARRIAESPAADRGLHERIGLSGPDDEMKRLADTFDLMLARLDKSFDGQRRFIANASHELRTPLTLNRTLLEVAIEQEAVSTELRQLGSTLLSINHRHARLIDGLLLLARSEGELLERSYLDLADIVEPALPEMSQDNTLEEAPTYGDPVLLERLVQNLIDNAEQHNLPSEGWLSAQTSTENGYAVLRVANTGPVITRWDAATLCEPFRKTAATDRLTTSPTYRTHGAGLGLSIVRAVARAHHGDVHLEPREGGGLIVTVTLPSASRTESASALTRPF